MKSAFLSRFALVCCGTTSAFGLSLYDTAPAIGLPESQAVRYSFTGRVGYDFNPNCSTTGRNKEGSTFVNARLSTSYSDVEAVDKITYNAHAGATYYFNSGNNGRYGNTRWRSDCGLSASMSHAFSAMSQNSISANVSYQPEPEYASGISGHSRRGDCLTWGLHDTYSQAVDSRWSWNVGVNYSGTKYNGDGGTGSGYNDDRQYITGNAGISYRYSGLTSYNVGVSTSRQLRSYGINSNSYGLNVGVSHAIDTFSSCNLTVGVQDTASGGKNFVNPTLRAGYNRKVTEGFSVSSYVSFGNENTDTYRGYGQSYRRDNTWRIGATGTYTLSPDISFNFGGATHFSNYGSGQGNLGKERRMTYDVHAGMNYRLSNQVSCDVQCRYNTSTYDRSKRNDRYDRVETSCGMTYSF